MTIPDHVRHFLDRKGLVEVGHLTVSEARSAIRNTLPTFGHAVALTDALVEGLGERGIVEAAHANARVVWQRDVDDPTFLLYPPLATEAREEPVGADPPASGAKAGEPDLRDGMLALACGVTELALVYDARGELTEVRHDGGDQFINDCMPHESRFRLDPAARPPTNAPFPLLLRPDLSPSGHSVEQLAAMLTRLPTDRQATARVAAPPGLQGGPTAALERARATLVRRLWTQGVPPGTRWLAADGLSGEAAACAAGREEAVTMLTREIWRVRPWSSGDSTGIHGIDPGGPGWPATPETTPVVLLAVPEPPAVLPVLREAGYGVRPCVSRDGSVFWLFARDEAGGFSAIGPGVAELVDPAQLADSLDAADRRHGRDWGGRYDVDPWTDPRRLPRLIRYSVWDAGRQRPTPPKVCGHRFGRASPAHIEPHAAWEILRLTREP